MTVTEPNDTGIVARLAVATENDAVRAESSSATDIASDQLLALLTRIGEPADGHNVSELPVQIEFGIESLQEMIADSGTTSITELAALVELGGVSSADVPTIMPTPATFGANCDSGFDGADRLTIKIIFGDDESNASMS